MNKDKQFYTEFLRQANKYVELQDYSEYICDFATKPGFRILKHFGSVISKKAGVKFINWAGIPSMVLKSSQQRYEVMKEAIRYCEYKLNQLK